MMMTIIDDEIAAVLMISMMTAPAIAYLTEIGRWDLDENDASSLYPGLSKPLLEQKDLGRVVANSTGYFGSDLGCKSVYRYMDYDAGLYRPLLLLVGNTRCMCTDTEFD